MKCRGSRASMEQYCPQQKRYRTKQRGSDGANAPSGRVGDKYKIVLKKPNRKSRPIEGDGQSSECQPHPCRELKRSRSFMCSVARSGKSPCDATGHKHQRRTFNVESVGVRGAQDVEHEQVKHPEAEREHHRGSKGLQRWQSGRTV